LKVFFSVAHDPTELNRQGPDEGTQYRSVIFYSNDEQKRIAQAYVAQLNAAKAFAQPIVTQIVALQAFYPPRAITRITQRTIRMSRTSRSMICPSSTI